MTKGDHPECLCDETCVCDLKNGIACGNHVKAGAIVVSPVGESAGQFRNRLWLLCDLNQSEAIARAEAEPGNTTMRALAELNAASWLFARTVVETFDE